MVRARALDALESGVVDEMPMVEFKRERTGALEESDNEDEERPEAADVEAERRPYSSYMELFLGREPLI